MRQVVLKFNYHKLRNYKIMIIWMHNNKFTIWYTWYPIIAAAAAESLQSCPTLCNPIDGSPPGSPVPGILQARILEWVAISFSNAWKWKWSRSVVSDPQRPHGLQPSRLLHPWDFPGKAFVNLKLFILPGITDLFN